MAQYITIQNLIDCRLATTQELILAYKKHIKQGGKCLPIPKEPLGGTNLNGKDFLFYKAIKVGVKRVQYDTN